MDRPFGLDLRIGCEGAEAMVREKVSQESGRRWIRGELPAGEYFRRAKSAAKATAKKTVEARIDRAAKLSIAAFWK